MTQFFVPEPRVAIDFAFNGMRKKPEVSSLWDSIAPSGAAVSGKFHGRGALVALEQLRAGSTFGSALESLRGRSVLLATREQLPTALALIELDGVARRMVLCTPDLTAEQLAGVAATAQADAIVMDAASPASVSPASVSPASVSPASALPASVNAYCVAPRPIQGPVDRRAGAATEW